MVEINRPKGNPADPLRVPKGYSAHRAILDAMLNEVVAHLKRGASSLRRVVFVLYLDEAYRAFSDTLKRLGGVK